jgi:2-haloacid dehalogenase
MKKVLPVLIFAIVASSFLPKQTIDNSNRSASTITAKKPLVILFDVNETLLDMSPLKKKVNEVLGNKEGFRIWFGMLLQYSLVDNSTGSYHEFSAIADATLDMAAKTLGKEIKEQDKKQALALIKQLKAYPDVEKGLSMLKAAGYRLATLTNSASQTQMAQLNHAGLSKYFEQTLSVDEVKKYKPALESYKYAAKALGVNTGEMVMVAAHGWDIAGALAAGMQAGFIERKGQSLYSLSPKPQYTGKDLVEMAKAIIEKENSSNE